MVKNKKSSYGPQHLKRQSEAERSDGHSFGALLKSTICTCIAW